MQAWETWAVAAGSGAVAWGLLTLLLSRGRKRGQGLGERLMAAAAALGVAGAVLAMPAEPPKAAPMPPMPPQTAEAMRLMKEMYQARSSVVGVAPDFVLPDPRTGEAVRLSDLGKDRPVVLVFGSWGCNIFCAQWPRVLALHEQFKDEADFVFVQVTDAPHALPVPVRERLMASGMVRETPQNRRARAVAAAEAMGLPFRHVLDNEEREVCKKYAAFPQRLVVVHEGKVAHDAGIGFARFPSPWNLDEVYGRLMRLTAE